MRTVNITASIEIDAPAAAVWALVADYRRDVEWRTGVTRMEPTPAGPVLEGTITDEELHLAGRTYHNTGVVTSVQQGRRFTWRTTHGAVAHGHREVTPLGAGRASLSMALHITPSGVERMLAPVLGPMMRKGLRADLERLRALVDHEHARAAATR